MIKRILVGMLIAIAATMMVLVSYSFFASKDRYVLREGSGIFWEKERPAQSTDSAPTLGYVAPDFTLQDLDGNAVTLSSLRAKPLLLNFWASWCPPCRAEMPALQEFQDRYGAQVTLLGVNWGEDAETARSFLQRYGISYTNLLDAQGTAFVKYRLTGIPTTYFIDEEGIIRGVWLGPLKVKEIAASFAKITAAFAP